MNGKRGGCTVCPVEMSDLVHHDERGGHGVLYPQTDSYFQIWIH